VNRAVPSGIVGAIVPRGIVGAGGGWISWTSRHAPRFRIVEREMNGLSLLNLGCVDYASIRAQWSGWSAVRPEEILIRSDPSDSKRKRRRANLNSAGS